MIRVLTIVGARPQIIKAAAISRAIRNYYDKKIKEIIVHTGQHYDNKMSKIFFDEMSVPTESYNLEVGSGSHAQQTALAMTRMEAVLEKEKPNCVLLYGDTNSTLAASIVAVKLHIPIVHIEGGVRSYNKRFPEEVNRLICDHLSTLIFVPTVSGINSLIREGFDASQSTRDSDINNPKIFHCGDIMYDNSLYFGSLAIEKSPILKDLNLKKGQFILVTMHRPSNVDDVSAFTRLINAFYEISNEYGVNLVVPLHPRSKKLLESNIDNDLVLRIKNNKLIHIIPPVSFLDMTNLEQACKMVITDSGGVQKEAYYFKKPCLILLNETPWPELVESGAAKLVGSDVQKILSAFKEFDSGSKLNFPNIFGDGHASEFICEKIVEHFS